jgi:hypothetical protein
MRLSDLTKKKKGGRGAKPLFFMVLKIQRMQYGRDFAFYANGDVFSVNGRGVEVIDVRWHVVRDGVFVGDLKDAECLASLGYTNVQRYKPVTAPKTEVF